MIWFWVIAGLLIAAALLFVLPPLLHGARPAQQISRGAVNVNVYRDQLQELESDLTAGTLSRDRYDEARREIERRLLEDTGAPDVTAEIGRARGWIAAVVVAIAVPVAATSLYLAVGNPDGLVPERVAEAGAHGLDAKQVEVMVEGLAARLKAEPDNAEGWVMLARSYVALSRFKEAAAAYAEATARVSGSAQLLADHADALAMAQGRKLSGEPEALIQRALAIDPNNVKALALAGTAAFENKQFNAAVSYWQRLANLVPPDSETARAVQGSIAEAQAMGGKGAGGSRSAAVVPPPKSAAAGGRVSGSVRLAPELAARVAPSDTVFIFAQAAEGPRMPLAIVRKQAAELPVKFVLDDSMAMAPGMSLSGFERVVIGARVSKSASANPQSGDLQGVSPPVKVGANSIAIVIDKVIE